MCLYGAPGRFDCERLKARTGCKETKAKIRHPHTAPRLSPNQLWQTNGEFFSKEIFAKSEKQEVDQPDKKGKKKEKKDEKLKRGSSNNHASEKKNLPKKKEETKTLVLSNRRVFAPSAGRRQKRKLKDAQVLCMSAVPTPHAIASTQRKRVWGRKKRQV